MFTAGLNMLCGRIKINLPWDREVYDRFEYRDEKLSTRRIHWWCVKNHVFFFWRVILKQIDKKCSKFFLHSTVGCVSLKALRRRSQVLLKCLSFTANWFLGSPAAVFLLENQCRLSESVPTEINQNTKVQAITSTIKQFLKKFFECVGTPN